MSTNNNQPKCFAIGKQAGKDMTQATKHSESGDARAVYAIFLAHNEDVEFTATVPGKDGDLGESYQFTIKDMLTEPKTEAGKRDTKQISARYNAIANQLFEIAEADNPIVQRIRRALTLAIYLDNAIATVKDETDAAEALSRVGLVERRRQRHGSMVQIAFLTVPQFALFNAADPKLKLNEQQQERINLLKYSCVELDGSTMPGVPVRQSLRELTNMADIASGKRAARNAADSSARQFSTAITFLAKNVGEMLKPEGEPVVALSKARRLELFLLQSQLAALFADEPLTDDEKAELDKRKAA